MTDARARPAAPELPLRMSFASNIFGVAWAAGMLVVFTPLYIRTVGIEGYGLIGFAVTLQILIQVLDFGFAPTINRWLARYSAGHEKPNRVRDFARTLEIGSGVVSLIVLAILASLAGPVARHWLGDSSMAAGELRGALLLMFVTVAALLPTVYYQSGLLGLGTPVVMNGLKAGAATVAHGGAALLMTFHTPSMQTYFAVHAGVAVVHALVLRRIFWRTLGGHGARFRPHALREVWAFSAGMTVIAVSTAFAGQADRIVLSRIVPLEQFGYYSVAWMIASGLAVVSVSAVNTFFPRFSGLVAAADAHALRAGYHGAARALATLLLPLASVIALSASPILAAWTGDATIAANAAPIAVLLTIGMALTGLMIPIYTLQLAAGAIRLAVSLALMQIALIVPLVAVLALSHGIVGAAYAWPAVCLAYFVVGPIVTLPRLLPGAALPWLLRDVGVPLVAAVVPVAIARAIVPLPASRAGTLLVLGVVLLVTFGVTAVASRAAAAEL